MLIFQQVYCEQDSGWTLVARFSNLDGKNWINGKFLTYYITPHYGSTLDPSHNQDMISDAFWRLKGYDIKITRSDDPTHTALLQTTNNCLMGNTFHQFILYLADGSRTARSVNKCKRSCAIKYGGEYQNTTGFEMHSCNGSIQNSTYIGFLCNFGPKNVSLMTIGGIGSVCGIADHGIAIKKGPKGNSLDFGNRPTGSDDYDKRKIQKSYALNFWVSSNIPAV